MKKGFIYILIVSTLSYLSACSSDSSKTQETETVEEEIIETPIPEEEAIGEANSEDTIVSNLSVCDYISRATLAKLFGEIKNLEKTSNTDPATMCAFSLTTKSQQIQIIHKIVTEAVTNDMLEAAVRTLDDREALDIKGVKTYYSVDKNQISFIHAGVLHHISIVNMKAEARKIKIINLQLASDLIQNPA